MTISEKTPFDEWKSRLFVLPFPICFSAIYLLLTLYCAYPLHPMGRGGAGGGGGGEDCYTGVQGNSQLSWS